MEASDELREHLSTCPYGSIYTLTTDETRSLNKFLRTAEHPFRHPYLQLAFDNFLESYREINTKLSFFSLMIALEALLSRDNVSWNYSLRRNAAVLLGKDKQGSQSICERVGVLYDLRSSLVHGSSRVEKNVQVEEADVLELRGIVRGSIKKMITLGWDKQNLMDHLTRCGVR